jgi:hypothetical protein
MMPAAEARESLPQVVDEYLPVIRADGSAHYADGTIDHPDGRIECNGEILDFGEIDWDELDPPEGSPDAEEIPHEVVMAEIRKKFGWQL